MTALLLVRAAGAHAGSGHRAVARVRRDRRRGDRRLDRDLGLGAAITSLAPGRAGAWLQRLTRSSAARAAPARARGGAGGRAAPARRRGAGPGARSRPRRRPRRPAAPSVASRRACVVRLLGGALGVVAARHRHHDLRPRGRDLLPLRRARVLAGQPSTSTPPASSIICGTQWPATKTGSSHSSAATARARRVAHRLPHARRSARRRPATSSSPASSHARRLGEPRHVGEHLAERVTGRARSPRGWVGSRSATARTSSKETAQTSHTACVTIRSDPELREQCPRRARRATRRGRCARAPRASISAGGQAVGDHAAGEVGECSAPRRVVALVGDRGDAVAEAECEQHLGRGRHE